jgi:hypothetical protein
MKFFLDLSPYRLTGNSTVSEKHTVSIFKAETTFLGCGGVCVHPEEEKADGMATFPSLPNMTTSAMKMEILCFYETLACTY